MVKSKRAPAEIRQNETDGQRKSRYAKTKQQTEKAAREERQKEKLENTTADRRLSFLTDTIYSYGYNKSKIAKLLGESQQYLAWHFSVKDDCRLSQAEQILAVMGLELKVELKKDNVAHVPVRQFNKVEGQNTGVKFTIINQTSKQITQHNTTMPDYVNNCPPEARMYFLAQYLPNVKIPITALCNQCEIDMSSLRYIFQKDDIKISQIFQIAKGTGGEIRWKISDKQK